MNITEIVTKEDIENLKKEIFEEIRRVRYLELKKPVKKEWLKSYEVRAMLSISAGTLNAFRRNGILPYSKIGGLMYYKYEDIERLINNE
ncbi:helix-turn-helix domain-containing protein [Pedobacter sp. GSP4]|uniref:helix-turn-helix domain-containing protein n=1 Tax=Pedobacter sp. GSP4 TaxID=3453716 RepID=UPI003EEE773B